MADKFVVVDGSSLLYRAFYALPLLTNAEGKYTNAVYGFTTMLCRLLDELKPAHMAVAFDKGRITFRNELYSEYKATRKETPQELSGQFSLVRDVVRGFGIAVVEQDGYEGDDIIGTLASKAQADNHEVIIVSGDRDIFQLVNDNIKVLFTKKGISELDIMDMAAIKSKYGIEPSQVADMKGLTGDKSDNIPGIPGIGDKTALKLITEFKTLENILNNTDLISGAKLKKSLIEHADMARLSKKLATINCFVPLDNLPQEYSFLPDEVVLTKIFTELNFKSLLDRLPTILNKKGLNTVKNRNDVIKIDSVDDSDVILTMLKTADKNPISIVALTDGVVPHIHMEGIALHYAENTLYVNSNSAVWPTVKSFLGDDNYKKITHDCKNLYHACNTAKINLNGVIFDTELAGYVLVPTANDYKPESLALRYLNRPTNADIIAKTPEYTCQSVAIVSEIYPILKDNIEKLELGDIFNEIEMPLAKVLAIMEHNGIWLDCQGLHTMSVEVENKLTLLLQKIYKYADEEFNVNSPRQLGTILFEKLKLPVWKKNKTGYSTNAEVLESLRGKHDIIDSLLEYRILAKLKSTYLEGLIALADKNGGYLHTTFNQTVTATGRLSSSAPNLQNIPIRTELGKRIREFFCPSKQYNYILTADYSQIELRVLAHLSGDENMLSAFKRGQDIHTHTAAEVFGVGLSEVTTEMRFRAKAVNFGIVYGISDYGLSRDIGVTRKEAELYIENYFARYPGVKCFMDTVIAEAKRKGYVTTLFGRRRYLPDINSKNFNLRSLAERMAMNTPIQGTAADIIKKSMLIVNESLKHHRLMSRMLLQVHDELVFEVVESEVEIVKKIVRNAMENTVALSVALTVDIKTGNNWADAK